MIDSYDNDFRSLSDKAFSIIYNMILNGELKPGEKLIRRKLATQTGVSTIPILEALLRLEAAGIVESMPFRGSRVIQVTYEKIMDWYALREAVECQVVRILATKIKEGDFQQLEILSSQLDELEVSGKTDEEFWSLHYTLHLKMSEYTERQSLIDALKRINLFNLLQRAQIAATEQPDHIPVDNHKRIIQAIGSGNPQIAEDAMREHLYHSGIYELNGIKKVVSNESPLYQKYPY
jgi:DNA-binding GntR family transcriptional regulator